MESSSNPLLPAGGDAANKTLSRSAIYTPLIAYSQDKVNPNAYLAARKTVPKSVQESSLHDFLAFASTDYHRHAPPKAARNTGSRPESGIGEQLQYRTLTLVGGGINTSSLGQLQPTATKTQGTVRRRLSRRYRYKTKKRRQKNKHENQQRICPSISPVAKFKQDANPPDLQFLMALNSKWNSYFRNQLAFDEELHPTTISGRDYSHLVDCELVGSNVRVLQCERNTDLADKEGILVSVTSDAWNIVVWSKEDNAKDSQPPRLDTLKVPRKDSSIALLVPFPGEDAETGSCQPERTLRITIKPQEKE